MQLKLWTVHSNNKTFAGLYFFIYTEQQHRYFQIYRAASNRTASKLPIYLKVQCKL